MKKISYVCLALVSVLFVVLVAAKASAATYYVDPQGNDSNSGTSIDQPWQTLDKASNVVLHAGDVLLFKRGSVFSGTLSIGESNITIDAYGTGELPILTNSATGGIVSVTGSNNTIQHIWARAVATSTNTSCSNYGVTNTPTGEVSGFRFYNGASNNTLQLSRASNNYAGVVLDDNTHGNSVLNNELLDNNMMNVLTSGGDDDSGAFGVLISGDNNTVSYNTINGSNACSFDYKLDGSAVEIYGGQGNTVSHNNALNDNAFTEIGNARSSNNSYSYNTYRVTTSIPNAYFAYIHGNADGFGPVTGSVFTNNTAYLTTSHEGVSCGMDVCPSNILVFRNNLIFGSTILMTGDGISNNFSSTNPADYTNAALTAGKGAGDTGSGSATTIPTPPVITNPDPSVGQQPNPPTSFWGITPFWENPSWSWAGVRSSNIWSDQGSYTPPAIIDHVTQWVKKVFRKK